MNLSNVTLWSCVFTEDMRLHMDTVDVMQYCMRHAQFSEAVLFTPIQREIPGIRRVNIRPMDLTDFNVYVNTSFPLHLHGDFAMSVHHDGFPIRWDLWQSRFLDYDYIGAPWPDGTVGNGGFCIESRKMLDAKRRLPHPSREVDWIENDRVVSHSIPADVYLCRTHRKQLETDGVTWSPFGTALEFSTEQIGNDKESFGFHGRTASPEKFRRGWELVGK
jgi:hypothetical protein